MPKLLIVDDEEEIRLLYRHILSEAGHEVFLAKDAESARYVLSKQDIDVAIVDRILPGPEDGLDILRFIQSGQPSCHTILLSGYPTFSSASEAIRHNAFDYLTKPVHPTKLCDAVEAAVKDRVLQQEKLLTAEKNRKCYEELKSKQEILQHDMRSLLVGIVGFTNLLINRTSLDSTQLEYCRQIQECGLQLENMVNTYLDVTQLEQDSFRITKTQFNFLNIVRQSRKTLRFLADEKNISITIRYNKKMLSIEHKVPFEGDRTFLQNAMDNLLKNAIESSPPDRRVKINIRDNDDRLRVSVHNFGAIPQGIRSTFFKKYTTSGKKNGLGLGTYMANLVIKAHGGSSSFTSSEDDGTKILLELPNL
jgi:signal transduction histidine kinase